MTTIDDIKTRLVDICEAIVLPIGGTPSASTIDPSEPISDDQMPFYLIRDGRGVSYQKLQQGAYLTTREMTIAVYLARQGDETYVEPDGVQQAAEACVQPLARVFMGNSTLKLDDNGIVRESRVNTDSGIRSIPLDVGNTDYIYYRGVVLRLRVTFIDSFNEDEG